MSTPPKETLIAGFTGALDAAVKKRNTLIARVEKEIMPIIDTLNKLTPAQEEQKISASEFYLANSIDIDFFLPNPNSLPSKILRLTFTETGAQITTYKNSPKGEKSANMSWEDALNKELAACLKGYASTAYLDQLTSMLKDKLAEQTTEASANTRKPER